MRYVFAIVLLATALSSCGKDPPAPTSGTGGGIAWGTSLDDALASSKVSGKPVLLFFYASW